MFNNKKKQWKNKMFKKRLTIFMLFNVCKGK